MNRQIILFVFVFCKTTWCWSQTAMNEFSKVHDALQSSRLTTYTLKIFSGYEGKKYSDSSEMFVAQQHGKVYWKTENEEVLSDGKQILVVDNTEDILTLSSSTNISSQQLSFASFLDSLTAQGQIKLTFTKVDDTQSLLTIGLAEGSFYKLELYYSNANYFPEKINLYSLENYDWESEKAIVVLTTIDYHNIKIISDNFSDKYSISKYVKCAQGTCKCTPAYSAYKLEIN